jgi:DNA modification methylase
MDKAQAPLPKTQTTDEWLADFGARIARANAAIRKLDKKKVELDIAARRLELAAAKDYAHNRPELWKRLDEIGIREHAWCKQQGNGNSLVMQRRQMQLLKPGAFKRYLYHRRKVGDNGVYGLRYAIVLTKLPIPGEVEIATNAHQPVRVVCQDGTLNPEMVNLITGDCIDEMPKMPAKWYHVAVTSMPYWPARRLYRADGKPIGFGHEPTFEEWCDNQVRKVGRGLKRVLRDDGVLWVVMDDAIAEPGREFYAVQSYASAKHAAQSGFRVQDSTYLRQKGNWLLLPFHYAMAMMDDGWFLRDVIIIDKGEQGRKESSPSRTRHSHEYLFMFTKTSADYYYDQDELLIPLVEITPASLIGNGAPDKQGVIRGRPFRTMSNPMGRPSGSVCHLPPHYVGDHPASFSPEMVRQCLAVSCPPGGRVFEPFSGSGTVAVVASQMGFKVTAIDLNSNYTAEAQQRLLAAERDPHHGVANENLASAMRAGD